MNIKHGRVFDITRHSYGGADYCMIGSSIEHSKVQGNNGRLYDSSGNEQVGLDTSVIEDDDTTEEVVFNDSDAAQESVWKDSDRVQDSI